jgi:methyl-accepting chemotaxis protein
VLFANAFHVAKNNITETDEDKYVARIDTLYTNFNQKIEQTIRDEKKIGDMNWYQSEIYQSFLEVKHAIDELMALNQSNMYQQASLLMDKSHRAIMPGIVAIVGALVFSLILTFFISKYYISPLSCLADAIKNFHPSHKTIKSNIRTEDEIKKIEVNVNNLIERLIKYQNEQN